MIYCCQTKCCHFVFAGGTHQSACPDCGKKIDVFGESHVAETAAEFGVPVLARIPIDPQLARQADLGVIESFEGDMLDGAADAIEKLL